MMKFVLLCTLLIAADLAAQTPPADPQGALTVQAAIRSRVESWNWFGQEEEGKYAFLGSTLRAAAGQQWTRFGWQLELSAPLLLGLPDDAAAAAPRGQLGLGPTYHAANDGAENTASVFLKQAFLRAGAAPGTPGHGGRLGRFEFAEGAEVAPRNPTIAALKRDRIAHRLLGTFAWSHVGRSFDGLQYGYTHPDWNATALVVRPTQGVFDVNGWPGLDVAVAYAALTLRDQPDGLGEGRLFALHYRDGRDGAGIVKTDNRPLAARQADGDDVEVTTLGGHYLGSMTTSVGAVDALLWGAVQLGSWGALDHRAWAGSAELGVQPPLLPSLRPWIRIGHYRGSGDADAGDDRHGTFFQPLPTPRIYARMPFYNLMNLTDTFGSLLLRPGSRLTLRTDLRSLGLESGADLWYAGGGAFEGSSFGFAGRPSGGFDDLATLVDISAAYRVTTRLVATLYYGHAKGADAIEAIHPSGASGSLGYVEVEYRR